MDNRAGLQVFLQPRTIIYKNKTAGKPNCSALELLAGLEPATC